MDGNKRPKNYELKARQTIGIKIESSASAKIGVVSFLCLALSWLDWVWHFYRCVPFYYVTVDFWRVLWQNQLF